MFMIQQIHDTLFAVTLSISSQGPGDTGADVVPGTGGILLSNWRFGVDPLPPTSPPLTKLVDDATGRLMDPNYRNPYSQQWNVGYAFASIRRT